ncbi:hypothetical protein [Cytobacillus gottheilii]|uniref:hypothetical protein n=1 Tax=Cytobacillus gottheilii TaxID=859144 RepID=UPI00083136D8|nr:hypothetical protein [Cytobacillus gottheilii]
MKTIRVISIVLVLLIVTLYYVPFTFNPPGDTRMIIDHNTSTYMAPPCFEESEATNYLEETTLKDVKVTNYNSRSTCTEDILAPEKMTLIEFLTGSKWNW